MFSRILRRTRLNPARLVYNHTARWYTTRNRNREIIEYLNTCIAEEQKSPTLSGYRIWAFKRAIQAIDAHDGPINSGYDAEQIKGVGAGISNRIEVFLNGDMKPAIIDAIRESIPAIGIRKARKLVDEGATIETMSLPKFQEMLTAHQRLLWEHRKFRNNTASREEAEQILNFCQTFLCFNGSILLVGDYRRGATKLKEISLLAVSNSESALSLSNRMPELRLTELLESRLKIGSFGHITKTVGSPVDKIIAPLRDVGVLGCELSRAFSRWRGWLRVPMKQDDAWESRTVRRQGVDTKQGKFLPVVIYIVDRGSKGSALLGLTGDDEFKSYIQDKAVSLGMYLNEYGLWKSNSSEQWSLVEASDEEAILKEIGMDFVDPEKRNFSFLKSTSRKQKDKEKRKSGNRDQPEVLDELGFDWVGDSQS